MKQNGNGMRVTAFGRYDDEFAAAGRDKQAVLTARRR
jgi:hypothetical protein